MIPPSDNRPRWFVAYQAAVLGISAVMIVGLSLLFVRVFQGAVDQPGSVSVGLSALGQVLGAAAPRAPAAQSLPGLVGTPTPSATSTSTPTATATPTATETETPTATLTPDVRVYDPNRAKTLLAQAQTTFGEEAPAFLPNVTLAAGRLNQQRVPPGSSISFDLLAGPYTSLGGYRPLTAPANALEFSDIPTVEGGITQVSTTLFQAAFWAGLKIIERHTHPYWLDRLAAGSTAQKGLDAYVTSAEDLRIENNTGDWIRIETQVKQNTVTVAIYGADPGWSVNPSVSDPRQIVPPPATPVYRPDPSLPPGQQFSLSAAAGGFDVVVQRAVSKDGSILDRYGVAEHYPARPAVIAVGPTPTPTATPFPVIVPTPVEIPTVAAAPLPNGPTRLAGLNPAAFVLPDGRVRAPNLVGVPEAEAQKVIAALGLQTTYANYQGPGDVPEAALKSVPVGAVISQNPPAFTPVQRGTTIFIAVRKA